MRSPQEDIANSVNVLVKEGDLLLRLRDLKRIWHVSDAWHTREITFCLRVGGGAVVVVRLLLRRRRRQVWELIALNHTLSCRYAFLRRMILDVPGCRVHHLPDARQVGRPLGCPSHSARLGRRLRLASGRHRREREQHGLDHRRSKPSHAPISHLIRLRHRKNAGRSSL